MLHGTESWLAQRSRWPATGRHILAGFDDEGVVVYQAFRSDIATYAVAHQRFGGSFGLGRMSWIKPNFLWMMYRSSWGTAEGQEHVLAVRLQRRAFDTILDQAVHSSFVGEVYDDRAAWQDAVQRSAVRLQWDPDHHPSGSPEERRAVQLGLRGETLRRYAQEWVLAIEDVSDFAREQHRHVLAGDWERLVTPREEVYPVADPAVARRLGVGG